MARARLAPEASALYAVFGYFTYRQAARRAAAYGHMENAFDL